MTFVPFGWSSIHCGHFHLELTISFEGDEPGRCSCTLSTANRSDIFACTQQTHRNRLIPKFDVALEWSNRRGGGFPEWRRRCVISIGGCCCSNDGSDPLEAYEHFRQLLVTRTRKQTPLRAWRNWGFRSHKNLRFFCLQPPPSKTTHEHVMHRSEGPRGILSSHCCFKRRENELFLLFLFVVPDSTQRSLSRRPLHFLCGPADRWWWIPCYYAILLNVFNLYYYYFHLNTTL